MATKKKAATKPKKKAAAKAEPAKDALVAHLGWVKAAPQLPRAIDPKKMPALVGATTPLDEDTTAIVLRALGAAKGDAKFDVVLRKETTAESRDAIGEALLDVWKEKDFHGRLGWIADAVGSLAGERSLSLLATQVAAWPEDGDTGRKRAIASMEIFASAGTDAAILALMGLRQTVVVPSVLEAAIAALNVVVKRRGTTLSELFDAVTPTLGLDANGTRTFVHDGQTFTVTFDDHFEPRLRSAEGALADLDEEPAWTSLAAQLREAVKVQTFRLEHDMIFGRRWTFDAWTKALRDHPLLVSFTRRLVWGAWDEKDTLTAFRTAEDRSLMSLDEPVKIPTTARIGVLHPLHLDMTSRQLWAQNLADYEIIQPFPQMGRPTYVPEETERGQTKSDRYASSKFKSGVLRDVLVRKGWDRDASLLRKEYDRTFTNVAAIATMEPGVHAGAATYDEFDQTIATIEFRAVDGRGRSSEPMPLEDVPHIAFSEALYDFADILGLPE